MSANPVADQLRVMAALYREPDAPALSDALVNIGEGLRQQCERLAADPTIDGCERLAANLAGARRHVLRLRERLMSEQGGPPDEAA